MITDVSQVLLKISILMSYSLTWLFHHVTCLVILSLATTVRICLYLVIYQATFEFSVHDLAVYPISMAPIFKPLYLYSFTTLLYWQECAGTLLSGSQWSRAMKGQQKPQDGSWRPSLLISVDLMHPFLMALTCYYSFSCFLAIKKFFSLVLRFLNNV